MKASRDFPAIDPSLVDRYARKKKEEGGRWITIGSDKSAPAGEKGGTPVYVGEAGRIEKGPDKLEGASLDDLKKKPGTNGDGNESPVSQSVMESIHLLRDDDKRPTAAARESAVKIVRTAARQFREAIDRVIENNDKIKSEYSWNRQKLSPDVVATYRVGAILGMRGRGIPHPTKTNSSVKKQVNDAIEEMNFRWQKLMGLKD